MVRSLAEVEPCRCVGSAHTGGWYQDLEQGWTARDRQEYFTPERFEQSKCAREKMLTSCSMGSWPTGGTGRKFIGALPMKRATNSLAGV